MTKPFLLINILLFCNFLNVSAQVIVSSKGGDTAHASAQLEVRSQTKGFLPPVLSTAERKAIQNPAEGLMVFDSSKQKLFVFTRIGWQSFNLSMESLATSGGSSFPDPGFSNNEYAGYRVEVYSDYAYLG
ncbi:MAG: hypothetical protein MUE71_04745, partial [Chitinophagaceae bacterium]|nr:hypothetical protein [Chitinophagaceae bacterium]